MTIYELLAIIGSILIPLIAFLIYLRPFIKDTVIAQLKGELDPIRERISKVEEASNWAKGYFREGG